MKNRSESEVISASTNVNLSPYNTLGVDVIADSIYHVRSVSQLNFLFQDNLFSSSNPVILGGGSNVLFKENPKRPVLRIEIPGIEIVKEEGNSVFVKAGAGVNWHDLVKWAVNKNLSGIENLALIPGTCGAAPIQNIGAYGVEIKDVFVELTTFNLDSGEVEKFSKGECAFDYRDSIFKNRLKGSHIVTDVTLKLKKENNQVNTSYSALKSFLTDKGITEPGIKDVFDAVIEIRQSKLPDPLLLGNAGSFFKNPVISIREFKRLKENHPDIPSYPMGDGLVKIPAGWLIEKTGWKGKKIGNVGAYKNQALVIVNFGGASGEEIYNHAERIRDSVKKEFKIDLTPEVNVIESLK